MEILWINLLDNQLGKFQCFSLYSYCTSIWLSVSFETLNNFYQWTLFTGETIIFHINASIHIKSELIDTKSTALQWQCHTMQCLAMFFCLKKKKIHSFQWHISSQMFICFIWMRSEWMNKINFIQNVYY